MDISSLIRSVSCVASPPLTPELSLRLVTPASPWWTMTPGELEAQGIPEPFLAFAWAGGQALARYILDHPESVRGLNVVDFGAGGGIVSLAAAKAGARSIQATEIDPWALFAYRMNVPEAQIAEEDWIGRPLARGTVLLCGDMSYSEELCAKLMHWFAELDEVTIIIGDAGRGFVDSTQFQELARYRAPADSDSEGRYWVTASVLRYGLTSER